METIKKATCPLDCFDLCLMDVTLHHGKIYKVEGDKKHPLTCGVVCKKGVDHVMRHNDPERLMTPMLRKGDEWVEIDTRQALKLLAEKLDGVATERILYYSDSGHNGLSKTAASLFFQHLGPITTHRGSLCWDAGNFALKEAIGKCAGVHYSQIENADAVILWGRNAKETNLHLHMHIQKMGKPVIYIDPISTATAKSAKEYYQINPNSDLELATGIIKILQRNGTITLSEVEKDVFEKISIEDLCETTGLSLSQLEKLAAHFDGEKRVITYIGYGLQRYKNGAKAVEGILRLHFLSGNVNRPGSGFHFSDKTISKSLAKPYEKEQGNCTFVKSKFGEYVLSRNDIALLVVDKANPAVQLPNARKVAMALESIPFKVGIDLFMTDTMKKMDLVFPAPSVFECQDVVKTSMFSPYLQHTQQCVKPPDQVISEYALFQMLAEIMGLEGFPKADLDTFLYQHVKPILEANNTSWEAFKKSGWMDPGSRGEYGYRFGWKDPSLDVFGQLLDKKSEGKSANGSYRLITPHSRDSLHSQGFRKRKELPEVFMNREGFETGDRVTLQSAWGSLRCMVKIDPQLKGDVAYVYEGYWSQSGIVNSLTTDSYSDQGDQAAYYETFVEITKDPTC